MKSMNMQNKKQEIVVEITILGVTCRHNLTTGLYHATFDDKEIYEFSEDAVRARIDQIQKRRKPKEWQNVR